MLKLPIIAIESCSIQSDPEQSTPAKTILVAIKQISNKAAGVTSSGSNLVIAAGWSAEQNTRKDSLVPRVGDKTTPVFLSYQ